MTSCTFLEPRPTCLPAPPRGVRASYSMQDCRISTMPALPLPVVRLACTRHQPAHHWQSHVAGAPSQSSVEVGVPCFEAADAMPLPAPAAAEGGTAGSTTLAMTTWPSLYLGWHMSEQGALLQAQCSSASHALQRMHRSPISNTLLCSGRENADAQTSHGPVRPSARGVRARLRISGHVLDDYSNL
jgi:hypothetical protein